MQWHYAPVQESTSWTVGGVVPLEKKPGLSFAKYLFFLYGKIFFPGKQSEEGRFTAIKKLSFILLIEITTSVFRTY